jgi:hypothetical protein
MTPNVDELLKQFRDSMPPDFLANDPALTASMELVFLIGANMALGRVAEERDEGGDMAAWVAVNVLGIEAAMAINRRKAEALQIIANQRKEP